MSWRVGRADLPEELQQETWRAIWHEILFVCEGCQHAVRLRADTSSKDGQLVWIPLRWEQHGKVGCLDNPEDVPELKVSIG